MRVTWKKPWRVVCSYVVLCYVCCCGCYASQERVNTSAVPMAPCIFFHPPSSCLAYHRFSKQCTQWDTTGQLVLGAASTIYCIIEWWFILTLCVNWFSHWGEIYQCFILIMEYVRIKEQANHAWFRAFCTIKWPNMFTWRVCLPQVSALNKHGHLRERKVPSEGSPARSIAWPGHFKSWKYPSGSRRSRGIVI